MKTIIVIICFFIQFAALGQAPIITSPVDQQVYYVGEKMQIQWEAQRRSEYGSVQIELLDTSTGKAVGSWLSYNTENDGSFEWVVEKRSGGTNYTIRISEAERASVSIVILEGTRPPVVPPVVTLKPIELSIRKVVSVEWPVIIGRTYRVQKSTDLVTWETVLEGIADFTGIAGISEYAENTTVFYKAFEVTP